MSNTVLFVANIVICSLVLATGLLVLLKNGRLTLHRIFTLFTILSAAWIMTNYFSNLRDIDYTIVLWANHLVFFFSSVAAITLLAFMSTLVADPFIKKHELVVFSTLIAASLISFSPWMIMDLTWEGSVYAVEFGVLAPIYFIGLLTSIICLFVVMIRAMKRLTGRAYDRTKVLFWSMMAGFIILLSMNFVLPALFGIFELSQVGVFSTIIFVGALFYTITKHKLFDIRLVLIRSVGYAFSLGLILILFGLILFTLLTYILQLELSVSDQLVIYVVIIIGSLTFRPLKQFFDKLTNDLFYRDAYDTRVLLDALNQVFISTVDLDNLLTRTAQIVVDQIKVNYCMIGVADNKNLPYAVYGSASHTNKADILVGLDLLVRGLKQDVFVSDYLDEEQAELKEYFLENDISMAVRIGNSSNKTLNPVGFIILGAKRSGNSFIEQDKKVMGTVAKELVVGVRNSMQFREIQNFSKTLQEKVDTATYQLQRSNEKLKALDESKNDFISMASHQLRTPLTSVKGYISMVLDGDAGKVNDQQRLMLGQAFDSSQRMTYLISDLLNLSRLKTGKFVIENSAVKLSCVITQELSQVKATAEVRGLEIIYNEPAEFPIMMIDETKIRQVIMNFVDNAIYYTPPGGEITVKLEDLPKSIEMTVRDSGIGVAKADQHNLFTKFYRASNARQARPDGTGLGLYMARKVIIAQGGSIIFSSVEGKGSTFGFSLPKTLLAKEAPEK